MNASTNTPLRPTAPTFTPGPIGGTLRAALATPLVFIWAVLAAALIALLAITFRSFTRRRLRTLLHIWGRVPLALAGVRVELHGAEHLDTPGPKLQLFNHSSTLDLFLLAAHVPPTPCVAYKREFHSIPGLGWALIALGMIALDRSNKESSIRSLQAAAERMQAERLSLMMAPEGTRSRNGGLQAFKKGAFHVAIATKAPIFPSIWRGTELLSPMGTYLIKSGTIRVDCLPPIDTTTWTTATIDEHIADTRALFLQYLPPEATSATDSRT